MAFPEDEKSISDSAPVELYTFTIPGTVYRLTTHYKDFTFSGATYTAVPGMRGPVAVSSIDDPPSMQIEIPVSQAVIKDNWFSLPPREMTLLITRVQQNSATSEQVYAGDVVNCEVTGRVARLRIPSSLDEPMRTNVPAAHTQKLCNHFLYDPEICRVARATFEIAAVANVVNGVNITVSNVGGNPDQWFKAGEIYTTLERRMIIDQVGTVLKIEAPFRSLTAGGSVTLAAGCDHTVRTCKDKFNNVLNFGGHPHMDAQNRNPFLHNLFKIFNP